MTTNSFKEQNVTTFLQQKVVATQKKFFLMHYLSNFEIR